MSKPTPAMVKKLWKFCDADSDGSVTMDEFCKGMNLFRQSEGYSTLDEDTIRCWFGGLDHSHDKKVTQDEMETELLKRTDRTEGLAKKFAEYAHADEKISKDELKSLVIDVDYCSKDEVDPFTEYIFKEADTDGSGELSKDEFFAAMNKF